MRIADNEASGMRLTTGPRAKTINAKKQNAILESRVTSTMNIAPERATAPNTGMPPTNEETIFLILAYKLPVTIVLGTQHPSVTQLIIALRFP